VKQVFKFQCAIAAVVLAFGAFSYARAQAPSATPNPFMVQLTSSPSGFQSFASDLSLNGRFVVFESNGDVATEKVPTKNPDGTINPLARNNEDGNREIFIADYAQRRIFQITNTKNVQIPVTATPTPTPTPTPSPAPSPTPTPAPTPADLSKVKIEISNNRPIISFEGAINGGGQRVFRIVFSSNAPNPSNFDGTDSDALSADANQEIWIYELVPVADVDLTRGNDQPFTNLAGGTFTQITNTPAKSLPTPGSATRSPQVSDDNREAVISDNGSTLAFISTANLVPATGNADRNPELFFWTSAGITQGTKTLDEFDGPTLMSRFQQNPALSADGTRVTFVSSADLATPSTNNDNGRGKGNEEVYLATVASSSSAVAPGLSDVRQVTKTKKDALGLAINRMPFGRRISRDGRYIAFESISAVPDANSDTNNTTIMAIFVYDHTSQTIRQVGTRPTDFPDIFHEPSFTDYKGTLTPATLLFASAQNFKADGTFPAADQASTGLNSNNQPQIFATQLPAATGNTFARLTTNPVGLFGGIRPLGSDTIRRIAFSLGGSELGGGNPDLSTELFYLLTPPVTPPDSGAVLSFFTQPSNFPVAVATPAPSPVPSPTPAPTAGTIALGLAAGEFAIVRSTVGLANSDPPQVGSASETARRPILPVELDGVSVSINGAAAGLYFVGNTAKQIDFVVPPGLGTGLGTVVINNNGTVFRGFVQIVPAQPDILNPPTNDAGGRAYVCNVTNTAISGCVREPFKVMSVDSTGASVSTVLEVHLTGVRGILPSETKVLIGTTEIVPTSVIRNINMYGLDIITFTLPSTLVPGDYPIIVTVTKAGTFSSREATTAAKVQIIAP
jgi:uncharacterized protein (TIGR03437 family)